MPLLPPGTEVEMSLPKLFINEKIACPGPDPDPDPELGEEVVLRGFV